MSVEKRRSAECGERPTGGDRPVERAGRDRIGSEPDRGVAEPQIRRVADAGVAGDLIARGERGPFDYEDRLADIRRAKPEGEGQPGEGKGGDRPADGPGRRASARLEQ